MNLPEQPPSFREPSAAELPWRWRLEDAVGEEVAGVPEDLAGQRFPSRGDAETWVGATYGELVVAGVDAAILLERDRPVGRPLPLRRTAGS